MIMEIRKLLVGMPSLDYIHVETVKCLCALLAKLRADGINHELFLCSGTLAHIARDKIAKKAINEGFSHVLWLDADMIFRPEILEDLSFSEKGFVSGVAAARRPPHMICLFRDLDLDNLKHFELQDMDGEPFEIAGCGFACVLIETEILRAVCMHYKTCFLPMADYGEDLAFCLRAREMGYRIWADPSVRLGHIGHNAVWPEDHDRYMQLLMMQGGEI